MPWTKVLDVGCGHGGVADELASALEPAEVLGIDRDEEMVASARLRARSGRCGFETADFLAWNPPAGEYDGYDMILLRDTLEHIRRPAEALARAASMLRPGGILYVTYAPFYSPFGGHQHNASGPWSLVPWIQALPEPLFRRLLVVRGNAYKGREALGEDIDSVLETRLTLRGFGRMVEASGLRWRLRRRYAVRPDYRLKFGLPPIRLPKRIPSPLAEAFTTAEEAVLAGGSR